MKTNKKSDLQKLFTGVDNLGSATDQLKLLVKAYRTELMLFRANPYQAPERLERAVGMYHRITSLCHQLGIEVSQRQHRAAKR